MYNTTQLVLLAQLLASLWNVPGDLHERIMPTLHVHVYTCTCTVMYTHVGTVSLAQDIVHVQVCMYEAVYNLHVHVYIILH